MSEIKTLKSPISEAALVEVTIGDVPVYKDPQTGGYWMQLESLQALADMQETPVEEVHTGETMHIHQGRFCPEDGEPLLEFEFEEHSGVRVDLCKKCGGIWLDPGEITKLLKYLEEYEFGEHLRDEEEEQPGVTDRMLLFLYQLTARPPLY